MSRKKVCHFTSAHDSHDDRIFLKECDSLSKAGYDVYIVAKGKTEDVNGIHIIGCGDCGNRLARILLFSRKVYKIAKSLDCDVYHFHDPELLPYGLKLKRSGKKVIFDSHEDVPAQILDKEWIPIPVRRAVSNLYKSYETYVVKKLDAVITATDHIASCFEGRNSKVVVINNYPKLDDIVFQEKPFSERDKNVCYAGGISEMRGEKIMINAMNGIDADLILAGPHKIESFENGGGKIKYIGWVDREKLDSIYANSRIGLCLLKPTHNYLESMPIKMFEYMAAGLPFVCSNFPLWVMIATNSNAGICVDVDNEEQIKDAIEKLLNNVELAQTMGRNGYEAVKSFYAWSNEERKLNSLYLEMMNG